MILVDLLVKGGVVTAIIFVMALIATFIIIERILHLRRAHISVPDFLTGIGNVLRARSPREAVANCENTPGPVAEVVRAAILQAGQSPATIRRAMDEAALTEVPRLARNLKLLLTIVHLAPLCGLLGTVIGMIMLFQTMSSEGVMMDTASMAAHLWPALLSTAAGLVVAIPSYGFYMYLVERVELIVIDMEKAASEVLFLLSDLEVTLNERPDSASAGDVRSAQRDGDANLAAPVAD